MTGSISKFFSRSLAFTSGALALALLLATAPASAEDFEPDLGQTRDWLEARRPGSSAVPADAYEVTRHPMAAEPIMLTLDAVPGSPFKVVDPPPLKRAYWKYPVYTALGLPRDLVDGFVGFVGFIPIVNLAVVGVGYELVPTQVLVRDPRDWHGWGGTRNKNGHGWIDSDSWGWFPTLHQTKFKVVNERKLARYKAENERLAAELRGLNREIESRNAALLSRQQTAREYALYSIGQGDPREAVSWILPAHLAYPLDEENQAVLVASLAMYADAPDAPDWVEPLLWEKLTNSLSRVQRAAESRLADLYAAHPSAPTPARALVYISTVMGDRKQALRVAQASYDVDPADGERARLFFEAAMTAGNAELAAAALEGVEKAHPSRSGISLLTDQLADRGDSIEMIRLRHSLLQGEAAAAKEALLPRVEKAPANPYFRYYLGCSELALMRDQPSYAESAANAARQFEQAALLAGNEPLRTRASVALSYMQGLTGEARKKSEPSGGGGLSGISF